jgi:T5SS/PEP-CTERM-associated repeat protein
MFDTLVRPTGSSTLKPPSRCSILVAAALALAAYTTPARAQFVWNNAAGGNWSIGGNWSGGTAPSSGAATTLTFINPATTAYTATNDIANPFLLNGLTFTNNANTTVTIAATAPGGALSFSANGTTNPTIGLGSGAASITAPVTLSANTSVTGTAATGVLTFGAAVSGGTNNLTMSSPGTLTLAAGGSLNTLSVQAGSAAATGGTLALTSPTGTVGTDANGLAGLQLGEASGQTASFTASGGAKVNVTENVYIGDLAGSTGTVTVTGAGTVLSNTIGGTSGRLGVGNFGTGTLNVTNGGVVNTLLLFGSRQTGSGSTILVDGQGSQINVTTQLSVGNSATGSLTIQNQGTVTVSGNAFLSPAAGSSSIVSVGGTGSAFTVSNQLQIGGSGVTTGGTASVIVGNGGTVSAASLLVLFSTATVSVNAGGTLNAGSLTDANVGNTAPITLNGPLNINGPLLTSGGNPVFTSYSGVISGNGSVSKSNTSLQELAGANTYTGGTTVSGGILFVSNTTGSGTGTGSVTVSGTGALAGTGRITGPVSVTGTGTLTAGTTSTGILTFTNAVTLASTATASFGINGNTPGSGTNNHDQLNLGTTGTIALGGATLDASIGYTPLNTDVVTFILGTGTGTQVTGTFGNAPDNTQFALGAFMGQNYAATIHYTANSVFFNNFVPVPEPAHALLACGAVAGAAWWRRRTKTASVPG